MSERIGFIGLGAIGRPMAAHVAYAFDTVVWNRTAEKARKFAEGSGATIAENPAVLVSQSDIVITCLPTSSDVDEVVRRAEAEWHDSQLVIDCTSGEPSATRATASWLSGRGVSFVDAPVSGGASGAERGTLTVMIGGSPTDANRAAPILKAFAGKIVHVGPLGAGHALKAINNALLAVGIQAAGEGLAALVKLGVPAAKALEVINASSGRSNVTENLFPERVVSQKWPRTFRLALLDKDVGIALKVLKDNGVPADAIGMAKSVFAEAREELGEEADHVELVKMIQEKADVIIQ